jgi:uncharacterized protein (DUF305 family)
MIRTAVRTALAACALALGAIAPVAGAQAPAAAQLAHTAADVAFMQGMIGHHAQALVMARMAPTHGASAQVSLFCRKVMRSQADEIELMQDWLRARGAPVPDPSDPHAGMHMSHAGMDMGAGGHDMTMPGMLTAAQLAQLDSARGPDFDRLFLTFMIQHHEGALTMVRALFDSPGAGQTPEIFGYATGVDADQRAEIGRMREMLAAMGR